MNKEILDKLDKIEEKIDSGSYLDEVKSVKEWGGADVIISRVSSKEIEEWLGDQSLVIGFQDPTKGKKAVITKFSKELSWLFY